MNTNTGEVAALAALAAAESIPNHPKCRRQRSAIPPHIVPIDPANLSERNRAQLEATGRTIVSRNSPCPCGSRKRFKRCCYTGAR